MAESEAAKVMLIAGGTGSIGGEIARQALDAGWRVALHGRTPESIDATATRLSLAGQDVQVPRAQGCAGAAAGQDAQVPRAQGCAGAAAGQDAQVLRAQGCAGAAARGWTGFAADLQQANVADLVERVGSQLGRIDAVIDCVSGGPPGVIGRFGETDPRAYSAFYDFSIAHVQRLTHAALPWLRRQGGTLIAFASDAGRFAAPNQTMIGASRAAIMAFVRNFAVEAARDGVRAHCVSPSYVEGSDSFQRIEAKGSTRIEQARRKAGLGLPTAADIAPLVLFLCSDGARRITGQVISVNGGLNA